MLVLFAENAYIEVRNLQIIEAKENRFLLHTSSGTLPSRRLRGRVLS